MGVGFGRSSVADLAFQVFNRSLHPEWFATREFRRIEQKRWVADVRIVEGGHTAAFLSGSTRITEVLCGPEPVLPEPGRLFHSHVKRERSTILRPRAWSNIKAASKSSASTPRFFGICVRKYRSTRRQIGSFTVFPPPTGWRQHPSATSSGVPGHPASRSSRFTRFPTSAPSCVRSRSSRSLEQ